MVGHRTEKFYRHANLIIQHWVCVLNYHLQPQELLKFKWEELWHIESPLSRLIKQEWCRLPTTPAAPAGVHSLAWSIQEAFISRANVPPPPLPPSGAVWLTLQFLLAFGVQAFNYLTRNPSPVYCHFLADLTTKGVIYEAQVSIFVDDIRPDPRLETKSSVILKKKIFFQKELKNMFISSSKWVFFFLRLPSPVLAYCCFELLSLNWSLD